MEHEPTPEADKAEARKRADEARLSREAERWTRRSRRVRFYRRVLPIFILLIAGSALSWTVFRTVMSGVERRASQGREISLDNPMFHGQDAEGRAFVVGAQGAVREPGSGRFRLIAPLLRLNLGADRVTEITAAGGTYDEAKRTVNIGPDVRISDGGTGFVLTTPEAVVDTRTGIVTGSKGVEAKGPSGALSARSYAIYERGGRIVFEGDGDDKVQGVFNAAPGGASSERVR
jgi:lipopolysaccharide export system protein LptC